MKFQPQKKLRLVIPALFVGLGLIVWMAMPSGMTGASASEGTQLFKSKCAGCHGPDGKGQTSMGKMMKLKDLGSPEVQKLSDAQIHEIIEKGKRPMPPFGNQMSKEQIGDLVSYIRGLGKKEKK